jgi:3-oxoadipate enol-lactonase
MMEVDTLYVQTQGSFGQQPIIFLHAFPLSSGMWKRQMQYFSKTHYTLAPDLPGFGKGALPLHAVTFEFYVDSVLNFIKESGIRQSIWCGLSMGGYVALRLYEKAPELCSGLILSNTKATADDNAIKLKRWAAIKTLNKHRDDFLEGQWASLIGRSSQENLKLKKQFFDIISKNSKEGLSAGLLAMASRMDSTEMLSSIDVPTLIIASDEDKITTIRDAEVLHHEIKKSKLKIIYGAGHLSNLETPDLFNQVVSEFLSRYQTIAIHEALIN